MSAKTITLVLLFLIFMTTAAFMHEVGPACASDPDECYDRDARVLANTETAPFRYRILTPVLMRAVSTPENHVAWFAASLVIHVLCFVVIYTALYMWLVPIVGEAHALTGVCLFAIALMFAFQRYYARPQTIIELALLALMLVSWRRFWVVVILITIGSLNRETAVLLVPVYIVMRGYYAPTVETVTAPRFVGWYHRRAAFGAWFSAAYNGLRRHAASQSRTVSSVRERSH